jgi:hypothetical protein
VLPKDSPASDYVEIIMQFVQDLEMYQRLCVSTRQRYEAELNWQYGGEMIRQAIERALDENK